MTFALTGFPHVLPDVFDYYSLFDGRQKNNCHSLICVCIYLCIRMWVMMRNEKVKNNPNQIHSDCGRIGEEQLTQKKPQHISCFHFLGNWLQSVFPSRLENKNSDDKYKLSFIRSVLFCSVKVSEGNCMLQPSTAASKGKKKKISRNSALHSFVPSTGVSAHSSHTIKK